MRSPLRPCPTCKRHVRGADTSCPFCHAVLPLQPTATTTPRVTGRMGRAAIFAFGATLAGASCDKDTKLPVDGSAGDTSNGSDAKLNDAASDQKTFETAQGDTVPEDDGGGVMPLYGAVSPDADSDDGGSAALYGAVPAP